MRLGGDMNLDLYIWVQFACDTCRREIKQQLVTGAFSAGKW